MSRQIAENPNVIPIKLSRPVNVSPEITWSLMHPVKPDAEYMRAVIAAALAFGSWLQDRPVRLTAAHVRRLLGSGSNADSAERKIDGAAQESPVRARRTSHEHALP